MKEYQNEYRRKGHLDKKSNKKKEDEKNQNKMKDYTEEYRKKNLDEIKENKKEYEKEYYKKNQIKIKEYNKEYYEKNLHRIKENQKDYEKKNQIKIKEYKKDYYKKNLDGIKENRKEYYKSNIDGIKENQKDYCQQNQNKIKEYQQEYYKKNQDGIKENQKEYYKKNLDEIKENQKEYYKNNLDGIKENQKDYCNNNQIKIKAYQKDYCKKNLDGIKENRKDYYEKNQIRINEYKKDYYKEYYKKNLDGIKEHSKQYQRKIRSQKNPNIIPYYSWKSREESRKNFDSVVSLFHITDFLDWYRISIDQIKQSKVISCIPKFGSLGNALVYAYPEYPWDLSKFTLRGKKSTQRWLYLKLKELLPTNVEIIEDYNHPDLVWEKINRSVQFDIWVPEFNLALEYQGEHHYYDINNAYGLGSTSKMFIERDQEKKNMCLEKGVFLVCIPYWWDRKTSSLCSTLNQTHPTLFPKTDSPPIPTTPNQFGIISD